MATSGPRAVVVVGASAGGVEAVAKLVGDLPADLAAAVCVVVHVSPFAESALPAILNRAGQLPAAHASDAEPLRSSRIYVCPPDRHLLVRPSAISVTRGPRENGHRPAVDPLFRSAAAAFGPATIGVVLSGTLDDGSAGLRNIKSLGGTTIVQSDAVYPDMPRNAIEAADPDHVVPLAEIAGLVTSCVAQAPQPRTTRPSGPTIDAPGQASEDVGAPSDLTCPACGGVLCAGEDPTAFRCRVGHAYSVESLMVNQGEQLEASLWAAVRALEERVSLLDRLAARFAKRGSERQADHYREERELARRRADVVRQALLSSDLVADDAPISTVRGRGMSATEMEDVAN